MDDRRIARALAGTEGPDAAERARRRWARWRVVFRAIAVLCVLGAAVLAGLLLRPLPGQAELQYTQGTIRQVGWSGTRRPQFQISLDQEKRAFIIDDQLVERGGRKVNDALQPGMIARVGFTGGKPLFSSRPAIDDRQRAWDLAINERTIYTLGDVRARAAREAPLRWLLTSSLLAAGVVLWFLTPRPRPASRHRRRQV